MSQRQYEPITPHRLAFLGLGVMGYPMAGHLKRAGHALTVYNRTAAKAEQWVGEYAHAGAGAGASAPTPRQAAHEADVVFACVGNDDDLRSVVLGEHGALAGMKPGAVFVDHTTASPRLRARTARRRRRARPALRRRARVRRPGGRGERRAHRHVRRRTRGFRARATGDHGVRACLHADRRPARVSSRRWSTRSRSPDSCRACRGDRVRPGGRPGHEARARGHRQGAAQSWQMDNRGATMIDDRFDFGFAVDWMRKDLGLCMDERSATAHRCPSPRSSTSSTATCSAWAAHAGTRRA